MAIPSLFFRPPADLHSKRFASESTLSAAERVAYAFFGCRHKNITLPYHNHQTCLDCGSVRSYYFLDGADPAETIHIGPWRPTVVVRQTVQQILPAMLEVRTATVHG